MWPFIGAIALFLLLALLVFGERLFERYRGRRADAPKRLPPPGR